MKLKSGITLLKDTFSEFMEDRALRLSAAMAYYAVFSIGPLLVLVAGIAGLVFGEENVRREIGGQLRGLVGEKSAEMLQSMMTAQEKHGSLLATIIGGIALFFGASGVFGQLQDSLNTIWEVKSKPGQGIWGFLRQRFLSMSMVLGVGFLLLVSMALTAFMSSFSGYLGSLVSLPAWVAQALNIVLAFAIVTVLFASIFKVLPDVEIRWRDVIVGALGTAALYTLGKYLLALYLGRESSTSAYGAGSAFIVILTYIYYSSVILFLGAEFTQVYARQTGSQIRPSEYAEPVSEGERANEGMPRDRTAGSGGARRPAPSRPRPAMAPGLSFSAVASHPTQVVSMKKQSVHKLVSNRVNVSPGERIRAQPWSFVGLALVTGVAAGLFWKVKTLRKAARLYFAVRRFV